MKANRYRSLLDEIDAVLQDQPPDWFMDWTATSYESTDTHFHHHVWSSVPDIKHRFPLHHNSPDECIRVYSLVERKARGFFSIKENSHVDLCISGCFPHEEWFSFIPNYLCISCNSEDAEASRNPNSLGMCHNCYSIFNRRGYTDAYVDWEIGSRQPRTHELSYYL